MTYLKEIFHYLPGEIKENHENLQSDPGPSDYEAEVLTIES
jgi:hypothetical protein